MSAPIQIGVDPGGSPIAIDVEELLATRLLVQGNSGSGKSHLLRRILEESAGIVQQVVIDPEGDFVTLADVFGHIVVDGAAYSAAELTRLAARIREHRASVVLALDGLEIEAQMRCAALFLNALFDAPREQWFPALVVVDEAQMFAPAAAGEVSDEARRLSLAAMTNLMCRGRKRGLAGIVATQRLAKLAKNVAAEASNFLMGRTFLDIDMARAADLLGMERRQAEQIRDLARGQFLGLGPAISRRPVAVRVGTVRTGARVLIQKMAPPPTASPDELHALLHNDLHLDDAPVYQPEPLPEPVDAEVLMEQIAAVPLGEEEEVEQPQLFAPSRHEIDAAVNEILVDMAAEEGCTFQPPAMLFQDFSVRCRMQRLTAGHVDMTQFRRRFAMAVAGVTEPDSQNWKDVLRVAGPLSDDLLAPFLVIARAAQESAPCPDDDELARIYGTNSLGRIRRLLDHYEKSGLIVVRTDFSGRRSVAIPELGLATAPLEA
ncbi:ATP-binding protein [Novosphingobium sp. G106]|uniref:ATP-binding protein n=1 Tax=Novosphingobium sp. G106 TaxID=2849500 RepID=UPI001C2CFE7C|nr:ATP-binding protein [Novosphingobium sp. G106]MBV1689261.1 ATP-binding protein [Novosphingobium sp. G106]